MVGGNDNEGQGTGKKRCYGCSKNDFLPEESFQSWGNYGRALCEMGTRLKDRLLTRSSDQLELHGLHTRSQGGMKKTLNWFDIIWFGVGAVMGAGVFVLTGHAAKDDAGPAVVLAYIIAGMSSMLSVLCYTEFSVELPVAGGAFAYLRVELGDFVAFVAAGNILFQYIVAGASIARSWTAYFATLCNKKPEDFRILVSFLGEGFNQLDPIAIVISVAMSIGACLSIKGSARFNTVSTIIRIVLMIFVLIAGLTKANPANFRPFAPFGIHGVLKASATVFFAYVGFDGVATLAEEIKNPGRDIPIGLIGSMLIVIATYCLLASALCLMQPYGQIDVNAPFTIAFQAVGMNWAKYIVALGALQGMTTVLLATIISQARYATHIARAHMAPPFLAAISEKTRTPVNATVVMTIANCIVAFFTDLDVLANLLSIATLLIYSLVALALIVRRYYVSGETSKSDGNKLIGFLVLIIASSIALAIVWALSQRSYIGHIILVAVWFFSTLGLQLTVKKTRTSKLWAVPFMPWLPSASIAINIFMLGSIDGASFVRFSVWLALLFIYYLFIGLHASYDGAKETVDAVQMTNAEGGVRNAAAAASNEPVKS